VAAAIALLVPAALIESDPSDPTGGAEVAAAATPAPTTSVAPALVRPAGPALALKNPPPKPTKSPRPSPSATQGPRCGAPENPLGYGFCGGTRIRKPAAEVCDWFDCVPQFWAGRGYLVQCRDGSVSLAGGRPKACAEHRGVRRTITK